MCLCGAFRKRRKTKRQMTKRRMTQRRLTKVDNNKTSATTKRRHYKK
jgi:hypothetical protein